MSVESTNISCLSEYINAIERMKEDYPDGPLCSNPVSPGFLYRGHSNEKYALLPSLFRVSRDMEDGLEISNRTYLSWAKETDILKAFIQEACCYIPVPQTALFQWAEYAQHYGVPTRLLDWSGNPLVALYFACRGKRDIDGKVWMLHHSHYRRLAATGIPKKLRKKSVRKIAHDLLRGQMKGDSPGDSIQYPILYTPYYVDARMSSQSSWFMIWGTEAGSLETMLLTEDRHMEYVAEPQFERVYGEKEDRACWHSFSIFSDRKQSILRELDTVGINEKTLFPGLDGIGRYIEKKFRFDYAEAVELI